MIVESAIYLWLYQLTLVAHLVFAGPVVVGAIWAGISSLRAPRGESGEGESIRTTLISWLPFWLGVAVTLGVAPLLFVQVLYQHEFYTANLLLVVRFFAFIPVLMGGFYLLYLGKGSYVALSQKRSGLVLLLAGAFFIYIASTWADSHLLSLQRDVWPQVYLDGRLPLSGGSLPRLVCFAGAALVSTVLLLRWLGVQRSLVAVTLAGSAVCAAGLVWCGIDGGYPLRPSLYVTIALLIALPLVELARMRSWLSAGPATVASTLGTLGLLLGLVLMREARRLAAIDIDAMASRHEAAFAQSGGLFFVAFLLINGGLIAWAIRLVRRNLARESTSH